MIPIGTPLPVPSGVVYEQPDAPQWYCVADFQDYAAEDAQIAVMYDASEYAEHTVDGNTDRRWSVCSLAFTGRIQFVTRDHAEACFTAAVELWKQDPDAFYLAFRGIGLDMPRETRHAALRQLSAMRGHAV